MSVQPKDDTVSLESPSDGPPSDWWSRVMHLLDQHFWRVYLVLVTVLVALIVFGLVTGSAGPLWAGAVVTGVAGGTAAKPLIRRLKGPNQPRPPT